MKWLSLEAVASVAYKEFLHIYRDRRVLLLVLTLPPLFTLNRGAQPIGRSGQHTARTGVHRHYFKEQNFLMGCGTIRDKK
jgi:hypothetical protein